MKQDAILTHLVADAEHDPNIVGFLVFGSVATGTHHADSDIDVFTVRHSSQPTSGLENTLVEGIKVGNLYFTYEILCQSVETVPYLLHPLGGAKLLVDRDGTIQPLQEQIRAYFSDHPEVGDAWEGYYRQFRAEKDQFGYEKTTIIEVWNDLEQRYANGKTRRHFFNAFYLTNTLIFSLLKRLLILSSTLRGFLLK